MKTVRRMLKGASYEILAVKPDDTVLDALKIMAEHDVGALLVLENGDLVGIITERDYARKVILLGKHSDDTRVSEIMTRKVLYVEPEETIEDCMALMTEKHVRHLPVVDGERLIGIISIRDVVKELLDEKTFMIEQLEHYITDRRPHL